MTPDLSLQGVEARLMRGPRAHSVRWRIEDEWITGAAFCHAAEGADCRLTCPEGCESWDCVDHEHELIDAGQCNFVEWMDAQGELAEAYGGAEHPLADAFIEIEYDDDHYTWHYSDLSTSPSLESGVQGMTPNPIPSLLDELMGASALLFVQGEQLREARELLKGDEMSLREVETFEQATWELETWEQKAKRLSQELKLLRDQCGRLDASTKDGMKVHKVAVAKRHELNAHIRSVPS